MAEDDLVKRLEKLTQELTELRTKAHGRVERKLNKYKHLSKALKFMTGEDAYGKSKEASDYFFGELNRINKGLDEILEIYKKK